MDYKFVCLSTSLFCCRTIWNRVLKEAVLPFVIRQYKEGLLENYQISLSYACGENIRLSLITKRERAEDLAQNADIHFKAFFSSLEPFKNEIPLPVAGLFLPFPSNTIQYGLYGLSAVNGHDLVQEKVLSTEFSFLMVEALGEEPIDDEVIITFAFYLHLAWIKIITQLPVGIGMLKQIYNLGSIQKNLREDFPETLKEKYESNKSLLLEITRDIMEFKQTDAHVQLKWLGRWILQCEEEVVAAIRQNKRLEDEVILINRRINQKINFHLGITESMRSTLFYFISNAFSGISTI